MALQGQFDDAYIHHQRAASINERLGLRRHYFDTEFNSVLIHNLSGAYRKALEGLQALLAYAESH